MPYEVTVLVQLSAIDTEDDAVTLANRTQETVNNALFTASGIPSGDLVVSLGGIVEYDADTDKTTRVVYPSEPPSEEVQQKIRNGIDQARRGETHDRGSFSQYLED